MAVRTDKRRGTSGLAVVALASLLSLAAGLPQESLGQVRETGHPLLTGPEHQAPEADFEILHLDLQLRLDPERESAHGIARYAAQALADSLSRVVLFSADTEINQVSFVAEADSLLALEFDMSTGDSLIIFLADTLVAGDPLTLLIDYTATPTTGMSFAGPDRASPARRLQAWTEGGPTHTRHWLPVLDHPGLRFPTDFHVSVPEPLLALANGDLASESTDEDGWTTFHFRQSMPHAPHMFSVAAGDFEIVRDMLTLPGARQVPIQYWVYPERIGEVFSTFGRTPEMIAHFGRVFDYPFPWDRYSVAVVQDLSRESSGNTGVAIFPDFMLMDERAELDFDPDGLVARVIAGQWFGHLVSAHYWDHYWLNAGFANYFAVTYTSDKHKEDAYLLRLLESRQRYLDETQWYRRALVWNRWQHPEDVFDAHSRDKGTWVLHMLSRQMGDDAFDRMIRRYVRTHAFESVESHHLETAVVDVMAADFSRFFDQWVYAAGHPVIEVTYSHDFASGQLRVNIRQTQSGDRVPEAFRFSTAIEVNSLGESERFDLQVRERDQTFSFPVSLRPDFVLFDPDFSLLADVHVDQPAINWMRQLRTARSVVNRLQAARMLARFRDDPALLLGLREALTAEESPFVRAAIVETMGAIAPSPMVERSLLGTVEDESSEVRRAALRALGGYQGSAEASAAAMRAAEQDESYRVVAEAVRTLARIGAPQAFDVVRSALVTASHGEVIREAAFDAMELMATPPARSYPLANEWTQADRPVEARVAATRYLGTIATPHQPAMRRLSELSSDRSVRVRIAAAQALGVSGTSAARERLQRMSETDPNSRVRLAAAAILAALEEAVNG